MLMVACLAMLAVASLGSADSQNVLNLTDETYDEAVNDGKLYFIKYYAPWCGHCKRLAPAWDELAGEFKDDSNIVIAHVDCTVSREVCQREEVSGYPTLFVVQNGDRKKKYSGARDKASLKTFITKFASSN